MLLFKYCHCKGNYEESADSIFLFNPSKPGSEEVPDWHGPLRQKHNNRQQCLSCGTMGLLLPHGRHFIPRRSSCSRLRPQPPHVAITNYQLHKSLIQSIPPNRKNPLRRKLERDFRTATHLTLPSLRPQLPKMHYFTKNCQYQPFMTVFRRSTWTTRRSGRKLTESGSRRVLIMSRCARRVSAMACMVWRCVQSGRRTWSRGPAGQA